MSTPSIDIADAVVTRLNAGTFSKAFTANRKHAHTVTRSNLALDVLVVPKSEETTIVARSYVQRTIAIDVVVMGDSKSEAETQALAELAEEIKLNLQGVEMAGAGWIAPLNDPLYVLEDVDGLGQYTSVLTQNYLTVTQ